MSVDIEMVHSLLHWWVEAVLQLLGLHVVCYDISVSHRTKHFHHQRLVVVVEVMLWAGSLVALLQSIMEVI